MYNKLYIIKCKVYFTLPTVRLRLGDTSPPFDRLAHIYRKEILSYKIFNRHRPLSFPERIRSIAILISSSGNVSVNNSRNLIRPC